MESTGKPNRIQLSQEMADELRKQGKGSWVVPREGLVKVKGKGYLETFWLDLKEDDGDQVPVVLKREEFLVRPGDASERDTSSSETQYDYGSSSFEDDDEAEVGIQIQTMGATRDSRQDNGGSTMVSSIV
jgi:hypothetical protein